MSEEKKQPFHLAVTGARIFQDYDKFKAVLLNYLSEHHNNRMPDRMIAGGALGADTSAKKFAKENNIEFKELKPQYHLFPQNPRVAPMARNKDIIDAGTHVIAFPSGESKGTRHAIKYAQSKNKPIQIYEQ